jgi:hypothetical protein
MSSIRDCFGRFDLAMTTKDWWLEYRGFTPFLKLTDVVYPFTILLKNSTVAECIIHVTSIVLSLTLLYINPKNAIIKKRRRACVQKKLYSCHLCRTFLYRIDLFVFMHSNYIAFKAKLRLVKVFLHICLSANAFFGLIGSRHSRPHFHEGKLQRVTSATRRGENPD